MPYNIQFDQLKDMTSQEIINIIQKEDLTIADADVLIGDWILAGTGKKQRTFTYKTDFDATDPSCETGFERSFVHQDWIDGESVVQAEQTSIEDGFNYRLHRIEDDIDGLASEIARAFVCLAEMRHDIHAMLQEVKSELNRLNEDVFECCEEDDDDGGSRFPYYPMPTIPYMPDYQVEAEPLGVTKYNEIDYQIYRYGDGRIQMTPIFTGNLNLDDILINPDRGGMTDFGVKDDRLDMAGTFYDRFAEDEQMTQILRRRGNHKDRIIDAFGEEEIMTGVTVKDVMTDLPSERFENVEGLAEVIAEQNVNRVMESGDRVKVGSSLGVGTDVMTVKEAPIERLGNLNADEVNVLKENGVNTIADMQNINTDELANVFRRAGVAGTRANSLRIKADSILKLGG
jgi:hypothetical protein